MKLVCAVALAAMMVVPAMAEDEAKKGKGKKGNRQNQVATQLIKLLEPVGLTEEQTTKIKELGKVAAGKMKEVQTAAGITPETMKKRQEAQKSMKDSDKKGNALMAAVNEAAGITEAQAAGLKKANELRTGFQKEVVGMLTDEQKAKLPERLTRFTKGAQKGKGKGKGKKKKDAA
ncbi:MAG: hypothetical protein AB8B91_25810 [Rubripirellula sp.]